MKKIAIIIIVFIVLIMFVFAAYAYSQIKTPNQTPNQTPTNQTPTPIIPITPSLPTPVTPLLPTPITPVIPVTPKDPAPFITKKICLGSDPLNYIIRSDSMKKDTYLAKCDAIQSQDKRFFTGLQSDGNLVLYKSGGSPKWATNTNNHEDNKFYYQSDGNLVLYSPSGRVLWTANTVNVPSNNLLMQNDGNLVLYNTDGPKWRSNTNE